jgi:uncharacterized protein YbjT (DUF2867 family)
LSPSKKLDRLWFGEAGLSWQRVWWQMILVTGAAGKTGRAVVRALVARSEIVRALVHRSEQVRIVEALGADQVMPGDMRERLTMDRAMHDARAVYHICPNMSTEELAIGETALASARSSGVEHFVYHSVLHPQVEAMPHHWQKMRVEETIFQSGLPFTILQPAAYMQNVAAHWERIIGEGIHPVPYGVETRLSMVDLWDVAEAASIVLTDKAHLWATYELAGPDALSQTEIAAALGRHSGRPVEAQTVSRESWRQRARALGVGECETEMLIAMFVYYEQHGFRGNPGVLAWLLGRRPTTFDAYLTREFGERIAAE